MNALRTALACALAATALASCGKAPAAPKPPEAGAFSGWEASTARLPERMKGDKEFSSCMSSAVAQCSTQYGARQAIMKDDLATCAELSDESAQAACRWAVVDARIVKSGDEKECAALPPAEAKPCLAAAANRLAAADANPQRCLSLADAVAGLGAQDGEYLASMCVIQALQAYNGRGAAEWCPKIKHPDNRENCLRIWKLEGRTAPPSPNAASEIGAPGAGN